MVYMASSRPVVGALSQPPVVHRQHSAPSVTPFDVGFYTFDGRMDRASVLNITFEETHLAGKSSGKASKPL